jgi:DNA invertase Pin-like site-specific DNA recombinase
MVIGYLLITNDDEDLKAQKEIIDNYANREQLSIDKYIYKEKKQKRVDTIIKHLDLIENIVIVTELSKFGNNLLESLNIIEDLINKNVQIVFVNQPELNTANSPEILKIYEYFLDAERGFISERTKKGLAAAKAKGKILGRPKGKRNKNRVLDPHREEILYFLNSNMSVNAILKHLNIELKTPISYTALKYYIENDKTLKKARENYKRDSLLGY